MSPQLAWYYRNKEKAKAQAKAWREANPERFKENVNRWKRENRAKAKLHARRKAWRRIGIELTHEEYNKMWFDQGGKCKICAKPQGKRRLAVDHNHSTGAIRGLLCPACNTTLGLIEAYKEDPKRWDDYLSQYVRDKIEVGAGGRATTKDLPDVGLFGRVVDVETPPEGYDPVLDGPLADWKRRRGLP